VKRIFPPNTPPEAMERSLRMMLKSLDTSVTWQLILEPFKKPRTNQQLAYLFGVVYPTVFEQGGDILQGFDKNDLHEWMLMEYGGTETVEVLGRIKHKPLRRTGKFSAAEFSEFLEFIQRRCAELGIDIPDPEARYE
jgi:hypothetical protein